MACAQMPQCSHRDPRCPNCRYWFERCCHALALMDSEKALASCQHFVSEKSAASPLLRALSC